jgi:hypothetical protein
MKRERMLKILRALWQLVSGAFILNCAMLIIASSFVIYPPLVDLADRLIENGSGSEFTQYVPNWYLCTGLILAVWVGIKGIKRIRG